MSKVAKATFGLMVATMLVKVIGFVRELVLTYTYGADAIADVYITSTSIPIVLFATIAAALSTTFIPLFYEIDKNDGRANALKFANNVFNIVIIITTIIAILSFIFAEPLIKIFAMSFEGEKLSLAVKFTKIMVFGMVFIGLSNLMTSWLQVNGSFVIPGLIGIPHNIVVIIFIILSTRTSVEFMAIGTLIGMLTQFIFQVPFALKYNYKYRLYINFKDKYIHKLLGLVIPVFIGVAVNQVNTIIDRSLASTLSDGTITILNSANRLNTFIMAIFITTITSVIYPKISKLSGEDNLDGFVDTVYKSINTVLVLIIPISVGAIILSHPIVKVIFERGAFDSDSAYKTAVALSCYSVGIVGFGFREILNRVFYSLQDTKTPMINGIISMIMNIILNIILVRHIGYAGLALATSISSIICTLLLCVSLKKKIGYFGQNHIIITTIKSLIAAIIMGIITKISYKIISGILGVGIIYEVITLGSAISIGAISYGIMVILLKVNEVSIVTDFIKKRLETT